MDVNLAMECKNHKLNLPIMASKDLLFTNREAIRIHKRERERSCIIA